MPVGLLILLVMEGYRAGSRKYNKKKAKKYQYDGMVARDQLGRPIDRSGKRLSKNEARAWATHQRQVQADEEREREWRSKGNVLPNYGDCANEPTGRRRRESTSGSSVNSAPTQSTQEGQRRGDVPEWQRWSLSGAPCYTARDEQARRTFLA